MHFISNVSSLTIWLLQLNRLKNYEWNQCLFCVAVFKLSLDAILRILCIVSCTSLRRYYGEFCGKCNIAVGCRDGLVGQVAVIQQQAQCYSSLSRIKGRLCVCLRKVNWRADTAHKKFRDSKTSRIITGMSPLRLEFFYPLWSSISLDIFSQYIEMPLASFEFLRVLSLKRLIAEIIQ